MIPATKKPDGIILKIYVQPKSSANAIVGIHNNALKIRLTAPPVDNAANAMCIKFLSKLLGIPKSSIEIMSGHSSRVKQVFIHNSGDEKSSYAVWSENILNLLENLIDSKNP